MKIVKIGLIISTVILSWACQDWLDVKPKTEIKSDLMFESESGFKDANIGCYMLMGSSSLYGKELTSGFMDAIGQQFSLKANNSYSDIAKYEYDKAESIISNIWSQMYTTIANINNILENIDSKRDILQPAVYHIFKGEALGLRAFLHFELLKMFGWGDLTNHPEYLKNRAIPYVTSYNKVITEQHTEGKVLEFIHADLNAAVKLLEGYDPWSTEHKTGDSELIDAEGFFKNRMTHFNYWAVQATRAKVYMWEGKTELALPIVRHFIENQNSISGLKWVEESRLNTSDVNVDLTFSTEHIFRLDIHDLYENLKYIIDPLTGGNPNTNMFYHTSSNANKRFDVPAGNSDYRYNYLYVDKNVTSEWTNKKFKNVDGATYKNMMPLIRMTEMYYIAAECLHKAGKDEEALGMINTVRNKRGIPSLYDLKAGANITSEIEREYRKEFLGEGQMFYYYKRLGSTTILGPAENNVRIPEEAYVLPIPENELNAGGREPNFSTEKK